MVEHHRPTRENPGDRLHSRRERQRRTGQELLRHSTGGLRFLEQRARLDEAAGLRQGGLPACRRLPSASSLRGVLTGGAARGLAAHPPANELGLVLWCERSGRSRPVGAARKMGRPLPAHAASPEATPADLANIRRSASEMRIAFEAPAVTRDETRSRVWVRAAAPPCA